ncbi:MAG: hypothetical protein R2798_09905 [Chitinophagales bacterium]|nr:hypothetical protein [Bacteroidota bacterium]
MFYKASLSLKKSLVLGTLLLIFGFYFSACNKTANTEKDQNIVRVYNTYLHSPELEKLASPDASGSDSAAIVKSYIDNWILQKLMYKKAEMYLSDAQKTALEKQVEAYRQSLWAYAYEEEMLKKQFDSTALAENIEAQYEKLKNDFILENNIIYARYFIGNKKNVSLDSLKIWFTTNSESDRQKIYNEGIKSSADFSLNAVWLDYDKLRSNSPITSSNPAQLVQNNNFLSLQDTAKVYLFEIYDYGLKNEPAPLAYRRQDIMKVVVNEEKRNYLENLKKLLYQEALEKNEVEFFNAQTN